MPGLGERRADIPFLIRELLARQAATAPAAVARYLDDGVPRLDLVLVDLLLRREYTHHVRELRRLLAVSAATSREDFLAATPTDGDVRGTPNLGAPGERTLGAPASRRAVGNSGRVTPELASTLFSHDFIQIGRRGRPSKGTRATRGRPARGMP